MLVSPCSIPVEPEGSDVSYAERGLPADILQACCWIVSLHLHSVVCWLEAFDLANVFPLGFE